MCKPSKFLKASIISQGHQHDGGCRKIMMMLFCESRICPLMCLGVEGKRGGREGGREGVNSAVLPFPMV